MSLRSDAPISRRDAVQAVSWLKKILQSRLPRRSKELITRSITLRNRVPRDRIFLASNDRQNFSRRRSARCILDASGDAPNTTRKAVPCDTKAFRKEYGDERTDALIEEADKTRVLRGYSRKNWVYKGYGLFQYDLQFVRVDPDFFFERQWYRFDACLERLMRELRGTCDP